MRGAMNAIVTYPSNTKGVKGTLLKLTLVVKNCPHCGKTHHHARGDAYRHYVKAKCGKGYYVFETVTEPL
jgi:hypothetical protein